jgi:hypothetical protein
MVQWQRRNKNSVIHKELSPGFVEANVKDSNCCQQHDQSNADNFFYKSINNIFFHIFGILDSNQLVGTKPEVFSDSLIPT